MPCSYHDMLSRYLVPRDMSVGQFIHILSARLHLSAGKALFVFVKNTLPQTGSSFKPPLWFVLKFKFAGTGNKNCVKWYVQRVWWIRYMKGTRMRMDSFTCATAARKHLVDEELISKMKCCSNSSLYHSTASAEAIKQLVDWYFSYSGICVYVMLWI